MAGEAGVVYGDWAAIVDGPAGVEAAARALLDPDGADPDTGDDETEALVAGYRAAVAAVLPAGIALREDGVFTGPAPRPAGWVGTIRAAVLSVGVREVIAGAGSDAQAARLLRLALRRTERERTRLRDAQRDNARRRHAAGVSKARIARDLGVQRVTVDAWLRQAEPTAPAPATPASPSHVPAVTAGVDADGHDTADGADVAVAAASPQSPPRRRERAPTPVVRFDPDTVRMQRWPDHPGGWLVYADDPAGRPVLIGHLDRRTKLTGRVAGWQPLDEDRHRLHTRTVPKTRPAAVAELLYAHEQRQRHNSERTRR